MSMGFSLTLMVLTLLCGLIWLCDSIFFKPKRKQRFETKLPLLVDYARSFFPILLAVFIIRSFVVQPFRVPSGSLEPSVLPGDFIAVSQFVYGLRLPVFNVKFLAIDEPKRGDIAVFHWPVDPKINYVKRVIGLPGDHVVYKNKVLIINGQVMKQKLIGPTYDVEGTIRYPALIYQENLSGVKHEILLHAKDGETANYDIVVPKGMYFMMGDNRDNSSDSRYWGFVPEKYLVGKAFIIWLSWDPINHTMRWDRIGKWLV